MTEEDTSERCTGTGGSPPSSPRRVVVRGVLERRFDRRPDHGADDGPDSTAPPRHARPPGAPQPAGSNIVFIPKASTTRTSTPQRGRPEGGRPSSAASSRRSAPRPRRQPTRSRSSRTRRRRGSAPSPSRLTAPTQIAPALKAAMAAGIKVVGYDSSPAVGAYNVFVNQTDFSLHRRLDLAEWACDLAPNCTGEIAILSATATATEPERLDRRLMKTTLTTDPKFAKGLKLVDTVYGNDDATESTPRRRRCCTIPEPQGHRRPDHGRHPRGRAGRQAGRQAGQGQGHRPGPPERHEGLRQGWHVAGVRPVERAGPRLPRLLRGRQARGGHDQGHAGRDVHRPGPQRRPAVHDRRRTAWSSSARRSCSTRTTSNDFDF